ncbi:MAG: serine hydrolase [Opitutaceae bacterium]|nr:serine hydrolase [Cytophagales bacterium]
MVKKILKWIGILILTLLLVVNMYALLSGKTYFYKALRYNLANVDDYKIFDNRTISKSSKPQPWPQAKKYSHLELSPELKSTLEKYKTFAFLVVKNDSVIHEEFHDGYGNNSFSNSFSVAKSMISVLIGVAIKDNKIKSIDEPVGRYLDEFNDGGKERITIKHLLTMSSGLNWDESYASPFSMTTEGYYGTDLPLLMKKMRSVEEPGKYFKYLSGNTQLLAEVLKKATGKTVSDYAHEKLWEPLGMENDALWCLDKKGGEEKAFCCVNSNARDFARIGSLYLHKGSWKATQIVDSGYVSESITSADLKNVADNSSVNFYGLQWWLVPENAGIKAFYARGIQGQYIIVVPEKNIVIVRLGQKRGNKVGVEQLEDVLIYIQEVCRIFSN